MANELTVDIWFDADGFRTELMKRLALTSGTEENFERIAIDLLNTGDFVHIGGKPDILDAEVLN